MLTGPINTLSHPDAVVPPEHYSPAMAHGWGWPMTAVEHTAFFNRLSKIPNPIQAFISSRRPQAVQA